MAVKKTRLSITVDTDLAEWLQAREDVNVSGICNLALRAARLAVLQEQSQVLRLDIRIPVPTPRLEVTLQHPDLGPPEEIPF